MARSLARNTRVFASTLTRDQLRAQSPAASTLNTFEIKVLDGYSFSQDVASQEVGVSEADSEAGCSAAGLARGTLSFNTALNPVDVSFSTYVRPYLNPDDVQGTTTNSADAVERILWASAMGDYTSWDEVVTGAGPAAGEVIESQSSSAIAFGLGASNNNELLPLTLLFVLENTTYVVEQFNVGTAEVDFSIDGIAQINWSGNGSRVNEDLLLHSFFKSPGGSYVKDTDYLGVPDTTTTTFLRNKLSTLELKNNELPNAGSTYLPADWTVSTTTITVTEDILSDDQYNGWALRNETIAATGADITSEWAIVTDTAAAGETMTTHADTTAYSTVWNDATHTLKLYNIKTIYNATAVDTTALTISDSTASWGVDAFAGGRITKINTGVSATILSNTSTVITLAESVPTGWTTNDDFLIFTEDQQGNITYCIPITGATLSLENNITYLTPEELAIVNLPLAGFAGNRITSGSLTAYLNTGAQGSGGLLDDLLSKIEDSVTTNYALTFHMGNDSTNVPRVDFDIPHAQVGIPTTNVEDIISTEITFTAKPWDDTNNVPSFEDTNEMTVTYVIA